MDTAMVTYLSKYANNVKVITEGNISDQERSILPKSWIDLLSLQQTERIQEMLERWRPFESELQQLYQYLKKNLTSLEIISTNRGVCMIYKIVNQSGSIMYYGGNLPLSEESMKKNSSVWQYLPKKLSDFYKNLHDGWNYFASESMGLIPQQRMFKLDSEDWGILRKLPDCPVNLHNTVAVFANGIGGYLCFEKKAHNLVALLWFKDKAPKLNVDFWPVLDTWLCLGLED